MLDRDVQVCDCGTMRVWGDGTVSEPADTVQLREGSIGGGACEVEASAITPTGKDGVAA